MRNTFFESIAEALTTKAPLLLTGLRERHKQTGSFPNYFDGGPAWGGARENGLVGVAAAGRVERARRRHHSAISQAAAGWCERAGVRRSREYGGAISDTQSYILASSRV